MLTVGAFDPGMTIGVALVSATPSSLRVLDNRQVGHDSFNPVSLLSWWHSTYPDLEIVTEDFLGVGPRSHASNVTLKVIGGIQYACRFYHVRYTAVPSQVRLHAMSRARQLCTGGPHAADALAHALAYADRKWS